MKKFILALCVLLISVTALSKPAYGYSYGDPNEELVAEIYKEMLIKLNASPPDYQSATAIFETIKEELDMHMGTGPAQAVMNHLDSKDKEAVIHDMEKILVLNIARRLESIDKKFGEYDTSKKLLAKAFATYKALSPVVQEKSAEDDREVTKSFESALEALGNPGLFGVGEKESNYDQFVADKEEILLTLKTVFEMESVEVGHYTEEDFLDEDNVRKQEWTDFSDAKNWIPIVLLLGAIIVIVLYVRKRNRS